jgi:CDGSH-type Zn-finger protein
VFDAWRRPWIEVDDAAPDEIAEVVMRCPSGALHFTRLDGGAQEQDAEPTIQPEINGPLLLRGRVRIVDASGRLVREDTRLALCRCGGSANKPFCDGTHSRIRFRSEPERPAPP